MGPDCRLERLEPTSVIALLSDGCKKAHFRRTQISTHLDHGITYRHDRIKHWIGTTEILSRWDKSFALGSEVEPTEILFLLSNDCKMAVPPRATIMSNLAYGRNYVNGHRSN